MVGLPLAVSGRLYNCAAFLAGGKVHGIVPKVHLPTTNEFYEQRWFTAADRDLPPTVEVNGAVVPFGTDLLFRAQNMPECVVGVEICEDLWAVEPPSGRLALAGATLLANPVRQRRTAGQGRLSPRARQAAVGALPGRLSLRRRGTGRIHHRRRVRRPITHRRKRHHPGRNRAFPVRRPDGSGGRRRAAPCARAVMQQQLFAGRGARRPAHHAVRPAPRRRGATGAAAAAVGRRCPSSRPTRPSVPTTASEIFAIQSTGLAKRLQHTGSKRIVIGVSGGLDSTLALLVAVHAFDVLGLDRSGIVAVTMPGFGTTQRTRGNAERLAGLLGATLRVIPIAASVRQHFADIGHDEALHDVTYENAQARERTQILMDVANQVGGFVVGTGDLSEAALGLDDLQRRPHVACTTSTPACPRRWCATWWAGAPTSVFAGETAAVLRDIVATPITPELLPLDADEQSGAEDRGDDRPVRAARLLPVPRRAPRALRRPRCSSWRARRLAAVYRRSRDPALAGGLLSPLLQPAVQALVHARRAEGGLGGALPRGDWRMPSDASERAVACSGRAVDWLVNALKLDTKPTRAPS